MIHTLQPCLKYLLAVLVHLPIFAGNQQLPNAIVLNENRHLSMHDFFLSSSLVLSNDSSYSITSCLLIGCACEPSKYVVNLMIFDCL